MKYSLAISGKIYVPAHLSTHSHIQVFNYAHYIKYAASPKTNFVFFKWYNVLTTNIFKLPSVVEHYDILQTFMEVEILRF